MRMPKRRSGNKSEGWLAHSWQFVALAIVAAATMFLVVLAFNRPAPEFAPSTPSPLIPSNSPTPTAVSPTPTSTPTPTATPAVVAYLGDSYTTGTGATSTDSRWTTVLSASNNWIEKNFGVDGSGYATEGTQAPSTFLDRVNEVISVRPEVVIVSGGRFDYSGNSSASDVSASISQTFAALRAGLPNAKIVAMGPIWDSSSAPERLVEIAQDVKDAVESVSGTYVDIGQPLAERPNLVGDDGILPTDAGHAALGSAIGRALTPLIPSDE